MVNLAGRASRRSLLAATVLLGGWMLSPAAQADALQALRDFSTSVKSARASFTQTVTSPDGARRKTSSGNFEFARPDRFRFAYTKPFEQLIVADGKKVWLYDADLNQVTVRAMTQALAATPASLLAGGAPDKDFELSAAPSQDGLDWVLALPRAKDGSIQSLRIGFKGQALAALEILDAFGQRSQLKFSDLVSNAPIADERFRFTPPKGADVIQPP